MSLDLSGSQTAHESEPWPALSGGPDPHEDPRALAVPTLPRTEQLPVPSLTVLRFARRPVSWLLRHWYRVDIRGAEHVVGPEPVILAANHTYLIDGPLLVAASARQTVALAKCELFTGLRGLLLRALGEISVDRRHPAPSALRRCVQALRTGRALAVFPEGRRSPESPGRTFPGWAYLALVTGVPVVPVAILRHGAGIRPRFCVVFGEPVSVPALSWPRRPDDVAWAHRVLRTSLARHLRRASRLTAVPLPGGAHA